MSECHHRKKAGSTEALERCLHEIGRRTAAWIYFRHYWGAHFLEPAGFSVHPVSYEGLVLTPQKAYAGLVHAMLGPDHAATETQLSRIINSTTPAALKRRFNAGKVSLGHLGTDHVRSAGAKRFTDYNLSESTLASLNRSYAEFFEPCGSPHHLFAPLPY